MKKSTWKKGLSVTLAAAMTAGLAAGCGSKRKHLPARQRMESTI